MGIIETHLASSAYALKVASTLESLLSREIVAILLASYLYIRLGKNLFVV